MSYSQLCYLLLFIYDALFLMFFIDFLLLFHLHHYVIMSLIVGDTHILDK